MLSIHLLTIFGEIFSFFAMAFAEALDRLSTLFMPKAVSCVVLFSPMPFTCVRSIVAAGVATAGAVFTMAVSTGAYTVVAVLVCGIVS